MMPKSAHTSPKLPSFPPNKQQRTKYSQYVQKVIESVGGTYKPDAAAHLLMNDGTVGYIMKYSDIQGVNCDFITMDEFAEVDIIKVLELREKLQ